MRQEQSANKRFQKYNPSACPFAQALQRLMQIYRFFRSCLRNGLNFFRKNDYTKMVCLSFYGFYSPFVSTAALFVKFYLNKRLIIPFLLSSQKEAIGHTNRLVIDSFCFSCMPSTARQSPVREISKNMTRDISHTFDMTKRIGSIHNISKSVQLCVYS